MRDDEKDFGETRENASKGGSMVSLARFRVRNRISA